MPRPRKTIGRVDKLAPDRFNTDVLLDELRAKIQLAEYEHKATFEKSEAEKKSNIGTLLSERRKNKLRRQSQGGVPDTHNITYAFEKKRAVENIYIKRKSMSEAVKIQDQKVCEAIKKYNLKVHEKEEKMERVKRLTEEIALIKKQEERRKIEWMNSPAMQNIRLLENRIEKIKMKLSSGQLISRHYNKIVDNLKEDTQNYPWKLDELEVELIEHQKALREAIQVNAESQSLVEKSIQDTKKFHEEYFERKKNRDKMLTNTRKDVDKSHKEVKGSDKPKTTRGANAANPMLDIINKEAEDAHMIQQRYESQRKKRVEYESTASFLKNACKVSSKEEILPAITQQHEVQRALKLQIENLEDQKSVLEIEKKGVNKDYKSLKYFGEKKLSDGMTQIETESSGVAQLKERLKIALQTIKEKGDLIRDVKIASENFFMVLQKYKIDSQARSLMTGQLDIDFAILTDKLQQVCDQIIPYGKVSDFLENEKFLDFMEDTLPRANTRVDIKGEEEEGADVFEDEQSKQSSLVMGREDIKKASQKIIEKNQGKQRRKKAK